MLADAIFAFPHGNPALQPSQAKGGTEPANRCADRTGYGSTSRPAPAKDQAEGSAAGAGGCRAGEVESEAAAHFLAAHGAAAFDQEGRREGAGIESRS